MKKTIICRTLLCIGLLCTLSILPLQALTLDNGAYVISEYNIDAEVNENGLMKVQAEILVKDCISQTISIPISSTQQVTVNEGEEPRTLTYPVSKIKVLDHDYRVEQSGDNYLIHTTLPSEEDTIHFTYEVRLKDYHLSEGQLFYYQFIPPMFEGSIQYTAITMQMPKTFDSTFSFYDGNQQITSVLQGSKQDKQITLTSTRQLKPNEGAAFSLKLKDFYFTYSDPINMFLLSSVLIILLICGSYASWYIQDRKLQKSITFSPYPPAHIPVALVGYISDGTIRYEDFLPLIVEWAVRGYILIQEKAQTIVLIMRRELPAQAPEYEQVLFNAIFGNYTAVTIDELMRKDFEIPFADAREVIFDDIKDHPSIHIFHSSSIKHQLICCSLIGIPYFMMMFSAFYIDTTSILNSLFPALMTYLAMFLSFLPWIGVFRAKHLISYEKCRLLYFGCASINLLVMGYLSIILLSYNTSLTYIFLVDIMSVVFAGILFLNEKRTTLGSSMLKQILSLDNFLHHARKKQLEDLVFENPQYYAYMLPFVYELELEDIWSAKFESMNIKKPHWYDIPITPYTPNYWMEPLRFAIDDIFYALTYQMEQKKKRSEKEKARKR